MNKVSTRRWRKAKHTESLSEFLESQTVFSKPMPQTTSVSNWTVWLSENYQIILSKPLYAIPIRYMVLYKRVAPYGAIQWLGVGNQKRPGYLKDYKSLEEALRAAKHHWEQQDKVWISNDATTLEYAHKLGLDVKPDVPIVVSIANPAKQSKGPGVIDSIGKILTELRPETALSRTEIVERLSAIFPSRTSKALMQTVNCQLGGRLERERGIKVRRTEDKKHFYVEAK